VGTTNAGNTAIFGPISGTAVVATGSALRAPWPNPTQGAISTQFAVARAANLKLSVVDLQGREVRVLASGTYQPGLYQVSWDGRTNHGTMIPSGIYLLRYQCGSRIITSSLVVLR
jgi:flagellar hook assembly protein FlgD